jgi:hypothetical protein
MRYKVGDKVVIRSDLEFGRVYGCIPFFPYMEVLLKRKKYTLTIGVINLNIQSYNAMNSFYDWTDEMIDHEATARFNAPIPSPIETKVKTFDIVEALRFLTESPPNTEIFTILRGKPRAIFLSNDRKTLAVKELGYITDNFNFREIIDATYSLTKIVEQSIEEEKPFSWNNVEVDTPILVWHTYSSGEKFPKVRFFAKFEDGKVFAWADNNTSKTTSKTRMWENAELYNGEDL